MNGKTLKAWALTVHDDAVIQVSGAGYHYDWYEIEVQDVRSYLVTSPAAPAATLDAIEEARR